MARAHVLTRDAPDRTSAAITILAIAIFTLMAIQLAEGGTLRLAIQLALFALVIALRPREALRTLVAWHLLFVFPFFAAVSAAWSIVPDVTIRYALQLALTMFIGIHLARVLGPRRFILVLFTSLFMFAVLSVLSGRMGPSVDGPVLIGLAGSKNQMALFAQMLLAAALAVALDAKQWPYARLASLAGAPLAAYLLLGAHSAGAIVVAAFSIVAFVLFCALERFGRAARTGLLILTLSLSSPLVMFPQEASSLASSFSQTVLRKDATLTGRTDLWRTADELIAERPLFGYGYNAVWLDPGSLGTGLRRMVNKNDGRTFHFHDTFRQLTVDTGYVGLALFALTTFWIAFVLGRRLLLAPSLPLAFFAVIFISTMARCFFELTVGPFKFTWVLIAVTAVFAISHADPEYALGADMGRSPAPQRGRRARAVAAGGNFRPRHGARS